MTYWILAFEFFKIGLFAIGGGFEVKHGLTAAAKTQKSVLAKVTADVKSEFSKAKEKVEEKVDNFIDSKAPAKSAAYSMGGFKLIQE